MLKELLKDVRGGYWDTLRQYVACHVFIVFLTFDVLCGGDCGTILPQNFTQSFGLSEGMICCCSRSFGWM